MISNACSTCRFSSYKLLPTNFALDLYLNLKSSGIKTCRTAVEVIPVQGFEVIDLQDDKVPDPEVPQFPGYKQIDKFYKRAERHFEVKRERGS